MGLSDNQRERIAKLAPDQLGPAERGELRALRGSADQADAAAIDQLLDPIDVPLPEGFERGAARARALYPRKDH
jgi:hypothetical protein